MHYSAKCGLAIACLPSVCPVTLVDNNHIGWKSWKLTARTINPTSSLFVAQSSSTHSQGNMEKFWETRFPSSLLVLLSLQEVIRSISVLIICIYKSDIVVIWNRRLVTWRYWRKLFTFVAASRGSLYDSIAFLLIFTVCSSRLLCSEINDWLHWSIFFHRSRHEVYEYS